ncbi:hypothetical protein QFC21_000625 [Naganishia friedmannii]|uniref:Uncharacterized protein n=1 Tax=Naganishia friedmannii TaxID=89922 RepID=A0ACC2WD04_9TREE|nr:hypothetical protein QFC21_000625 [Naganishia friedmannii]
MGSKAIKMGLDAEFENMAASLGIELTCEYKARRKLQVGPRPAVGKLHQRNQRELTLHPEYCSRYEGGNGSYNGVPYDPVIYSSNDSSGPQQGHPFENSTAVTQLSQYLPYDAQQEGWQPDINYRPSPTHSDSHTEALVTNDQTLPAGPMINQQRQESMVAMSQVGSTKNIPLMGMVPEQQLRLAYYRNLDAYRKSIQQGQPPRGKHKYSKTIVK